MIYWQLAIDKIGQNAGSPIMTRVMHVIYHTTRLDIDPVDALASSSRFGPPTSPPRGMGCTCPTIRLPDLAISRIV